jgi:peptidase C10-like protein/Spi protease inhibitor
MLSYSNRLIWATSFIAIFIFFSCQKSNPSFLQIKFEKNTKIVPEATARAVAKNFNPVVFYDLSNSSNHTPYNSSLNGNNQIKSEYTIKDHADLPAIYVYSFTDNNGYLFVSADYQMQPILAFVENGEFKKGKAPGGIIMWLNKTINDIEILRKGLYNNLLLASAAWSNYLNSISGNKADMISSLPQVQPPPPPPNPCSTNPNYTSSTTQTIGPLISVAWGQWDTYNNLCPNLGCSTPTDRDAPTGCVATAMAQVIRYYQKPLNKYNYTAMPTNSGDINVQHLMLDAGSSVGMQYSCTPGSHPPNEVWAIDGILTNTSTAQRAASGFLNTSYFGYTSASAKMYGASDYSIVQNNISYGWPVILSGYPDWNSFWDYPEGEGHTWVCDGTSATTFSFCSNGSLSSYQTLAFHMNWGWQEAGITTNYNGWFGFDDWYIPQNGLNYQFFDELTYNIHP